MKRLIKRVVALGFCIALLGTNVLPASAELENSVDLEQTENEAADLQQEEEQVAEEEQPVEEEQLTEEEQPAEEELPAEEEAPAEEEEPVEEIPTMTFNETTEEDQPEEMQMPSLKIQAHVQNDGWQNWKSSGELVGTTGRSLRVEALKIEIDSIYEGDIEYRVHVQNEGWQDWKRNGELAGTTGKSLRIEAIQIRLTGDLAERFGLVYATHVADIGWLGEVTTGEFAGTEGYSKRMESLILQIKPIDEVQGSSKAGFVKKSSGRALQYSGHVQNIGDVSAVSNGAILGTSGKSLRIEGMKITVNTDELGVSGGIKYRVHVQDYGWMDWVSNGQFVGTKGESKRIEALQIELTGDVAEKYNIFYRVHVQNIGWMGWAKNGEMAGTANHAYRMEAVQILLQQKEAPVPGTTSDHYREGKNGWFYEGGYKFYYQNSVKLTDVRNIIGQQPSYEITINKQMSCVTVYAKDGNNGYIIPVVAFACSPGSATPTGTFYTSDKYRWQQLYGAMGQWCTRITGHILFHSPPYTSKNNRTLWAKEYNKLGTWASQGCVRLRSGDAKWLYDNCASRTKVTIYNSSTPGPLGKPEYAKIPLSQNWDPTDPTV